MRNSISDKHNFEKEMYTKLYTNKPGSRQTERNPIIENPPQRLYDSQPKKKNRMLAKGDFYEKHQGTFALQYGDTEDFKPSKKYFSQNYEDPIKPPEIIPPANFKRPERNPITHGDPYYQPEIRTRPDQVSNIFNKDPVSYQERKNL